MPDSKKLLWAAAFLGLGWALGYAAGSDPEFMISIDAPMGETRVECISGCRLKGSRDLGVPGAGTMNNYAYRCDDPVTKRCSARVAGWRVE